MNIRIQPSSPRVSAPECVLGRPSPPGGGEDDSRKGRSRAVGGGGDPLLRRYSRGGGKPGVIPLSARKRLGGLCKGRNRHSHSPRKEGRTSAPPWAYSIQSPFANGSVLGTNWAFPRKRLHHPTKCPSLGSSANTRGSGTTMRAALRRAGWAGPGQTTLHCAGGSGPWEEGVRSATGRRCGPWVRAARSAESVEQRLRSIPFHGMRLVRVLAEALQQAPR